MEGKMDISLESIFKLLSKIVNNRLKIDNQIDYLNVEEQFFNLPKSDNLSYRYALCNSIFSNSSNKNINVLETKVEILEKKIYLRSDLRFIYNIDNQKFIMYALNNGSLDTDRDYFNLSMEPILEGGIKDINNNYQETFRLKLKPGEIKKVVEVDLNEKFGKLFMKNKKYVYIQPNFSSKTSGSFKQGIIDIYYNRNENSFSYQGMGGSGGPSNRYNLVEITKEDHKKLYEFHNNTEIEAESSNNIYTVITADESCSIKFKLSFKLNKNHLKIINNQDEIEIRIIVPIFKLPGSRKITYDNDVFKTLVKLKIQEYTIGNLDYIDRKIMADSDEDKKEIKNRFK